MSAQPARHPQGSPHGTGGQFAPRRAGEPAFAVGDGPSLLDMDTVGEVVYDVGEPIDVSADDLLSSYNVMGQDPQVLALLDKHYPGMDAGHRQESARRLAWASAVLVWIRDGGYDCMYRADDYDAARPPGERRFNVELSSSVDVAELKERVVEDLRERAYTVFVDIGNEYRRARPPASPA